MKTIKNNTGLIRLFDESRELFLCVAEKINNDLRQNYPASEYRMLLLLKRIGKAKLSDVAEFIGPKPVACTKLGALERKKLVARIISPEDKRNVHYYLTPKGEKYCDNLMAVINASINQIFASLPNKDMADLMLALEKMNKVLIKVI